MHSNSFIIKGDICYSASPTELTALEGGFAVCINGRSAGVYSSVPAQYAHLPLYDFSGKIVIPGLVDLHIHAPQYAFRGTGMDLELMQWLQQQAFPEEARYADGDYAARAYGIFAHQLRQSATTHACIFATCHTPATLLLMECMEGSGLVSFVGKVNMDLDAPDALREESAAHSATQTRLWLDSCRGRFQRTKPILTPRFIPSCSEALLSQLSEIRREYALPVQSHLSENPGEIQLVQLTRPHAAFYGDAYHQHSLFGLDRATGEPVKTVMAHCVYSSPAEMARMRENGVFIAHCPASNMNLASGIAPIRKYLSAGLRVGLGSDVAGGHTASMLRAVCDAVQVSKLYWRLIDPAQKPLTFPEAFYLATVGGGAFFGDVGSLTAGYDFSAVVLDEASIPYPGHFTLPERLERSAYLSLDLTGICAKFVSGERVL